MRAISLITGVSILLLLVGGCQSGENTEQAISPSPSPVARPPQKPKPSATPPFGEKPLVAKQPGTASTGVPGLIPPQMPDEVVKRIAKGRTDPFTAVPVQPEVTVSPNPSAPRANRPVPPIPPLPPAGGVPRNPNRGRTATPGQARNGGQQRGTGARTTPPQRTTSNRPSGNGANRPAGGGAQPSQPSNPSFPPPPSDGSIAVAPRPIPDLPDLPEPTQARGVEVTGVVQVGGTPVAIVKVPNEPARYVRPGQRIANGQVLVKRIEMNRGPTPVVILEQYGVEVARGVGDSPSNTPGLPGQPPQGPTASVGTPNLRNSTSRA